ncbi:MAG TPA: LysM peptidoglycan-binding domain-containing protein [Anaerolineae bacterium]|nr:LysM peptidoglycan-binding domain-containing protein [Anaerolineae bacterium]
MKKHTFPGKWIFIGSIALLLVLSACVRPTPQEGPSAPTVPPATAVPTLAPVAPVPEPGQPPDGTAPEGSQPEGSQPEGTQPEGSQPEGTQPEGSQPEGTQPTAPPAAGGDQSAGPVTHVVQPGETVYRLSVQYGVSVEAIGQANNLGPYYTIYVGQTLIIPVGGVTPPPGGGAPPGGGTPGCSTYHVVRPGENLFRIGLAYGYTVDQLAAANPDIVNPNNIKVGQSICIP